MLSLKPCRMLLVAAVIGTMTQASYAGCNCSVPPSPILSAPVVSPVPAGSAAWPGTTGYANSPGGYAGSAYGSMMNGFTDYEGAGPHWAPGGYEARVGSPAYYHDPAGGEYVVTGNPDYDHFGPGFQRHSLHGHYRYPYYNYRTPWYYPGRAVYNRNTNFAW